MASSLECRTRVPVVSIRGEGMCEGARNPPTTKDYQPQAAARNSKGIPHASPAMLTQVFGMTG
jgi:hypothetical protein